MLCLGGYRGAYITKLSRYQTARIKPLPAASAAPGRHPGGAAGHQARGQQTGARAAGQGETIKPGGMQTGRAGLLHPCTSGGTGRRHRLTAGISRERTHTHRRGQPPTGSRSAAQDTRQGQPLTCRQARPAHRPTGSRQAQAKTQDTKDHKAKNQTKRARPHTPARKITTRPRAGPPNARAHICGFGSAKFF